MLSRNWRHLCRRYSQAVTFRTSEVSPSLHNEKQIGLFYTLDKDVCKQLFSHGGFPRSFQKQNKTFTETTIMVRQPALDIINCIRATDMEKPVIRYVLYGENGVGKSLTLAHLLHYAHEQGFLIVHVPWGTGTAVQSVKLVPMTPRYVVPPEKGLTQGVNQDVTPVSEWLRRLPRHKEMGNSQTREGFVDLPLDAAAWLIHFKTQNQAILKNPEVKISKEYVWSKREVSGAGAPLAELVEHGITRVKYACDVVDALLHEIKTLSDTKQIKTFVAIDGFNSFLYPLTRLNTPTKKKVKPEEVTLTTSFMEFTKNDWTNGVIVVTTDQLAVPDDRHESFLPKYLLYKKGFEHLDPFVPVEVGRYSDKEFLTCSNYYRDRLWLRGPPEVESELKLTSACNPYRFMEQCAPL